MRRETSVARGSTLQRDSAFRSLSACGQAEDD